MTTLIQQSTANDPLFFFLVLSSDHISPATGKSPTVTISKNGAAFGSPAGAVTEIANGWYQVAGNATDTNTLGDLLLHATEASSDNCDLVAAQVVAFNPRDSVRVGLTSLPNAAANAVGGLPVLDSNSLIDVDVKRIFGVALAAQALSQSTQSICWGTCSGGTTTTAVVSTLNNPSSLTDTNQLIARTIIFLGNTGTANMQAQASNITASTTGATPTLTFSVMTHAPANGDLFVVL